MSQLTGIVHINVNGDRLRSKPGATINPGGVSRTTQSGAARNDHGYSQTPVPSRVTLELMPDANTSLAEIREWASVNIIVECDTGQTYVGQGCWVTEVPELTGGDSSSVSVTLEGPELQEV